MPRALSETPDRGRPTDAFCRHRLAPQALAHRGHRRGGRATAVAADHQRPADVPGAAGGRRGVSGRAGGDVRLGVAGRRAPGRRLRAAPGAPDAHQGDRVGAGEDRRRRRAHAGAPVARRPAARGLFAPRELRDLRDLLRHRVALTRMRSALKNRVSAVLAKNGVERAYSDLFGPGGLRFLAELELREGPRRRLDSTLALIGDFTREIDATSREIDARASDDPYVPVLCQIRGVGRYIAMLVIAEVGDITRFATARRLCSWAGLTPTVRSSDGKARLGHISGQGSPPLRWALVQAAQHAAGGGGPLRDSYERIPKRRGHQSARVAVARRILTLCFYGLRDGEIRCLVPRATTRAVRPPAVSA